MQLYYRQTGGEMQELIQVGYISVIIVAYLAEGGYINTVEIMAKIMVQ